MKARDFAKMLLIAFVAFAGPTGCKEATLGPDLRGSLEGTVLDHATSRGLGHVSITTSPPTGALVTDETGRFRLDELPAGTYTLTARHPGYQSATATVSVQENRTTQVMLALTQTADPAGATAALEVEVTRWSHRSVGDSVFVEVEYRARNTGDAGLTAYEIYFRIDTDEASYYHEVQGDTLRARQSDIGRFERYVSAPAREVVVEDVWFAE